MSDARPSRRSFLAMLGVLVGAGAAGGLAWLRSGDPDPASTGAETLPAPETTATTTGQTVESRSSTLPATTEESTTTTSSASSTTEPTTTEPITTEPTTTTEPPTTTTEPATSTTTPVETAAGRIEVICKEAWGASPVQGQLIEHRIDRLTVHHTAVVMGSNTAAPGRIRSYQSYHQDQGWPDVAYHYLIDANGHVYEGRPVSARGDTFTEYDPAGHFLVCCDGHFDQQDIPAAQLDALADVLAWAAVQFGAAPSTIAGHRDYAATTCPGRNLASLTADGTLRSMVEQRVGGVSLNLLCGQTGLDRVADIESGLL